jgi:hypothetical protein
MNLHSFKGKKLIPDIFHIDRVGNGAEIGIVIVVRVGGTFSIGLTNAQSHGDPDYNLKCRKWVNF